MQFVASTEDWRSIKSFGFADHPNVSIATYQAPYSETRLRKTINGYRGAPLHAVLETFFNIRDFSNAMLTDRRLSCQVQVSNCCLSYISCTYACCSSHTNSCPKKVDKNCCNLQLVQKLLPVLHVRVPQDLDVISSLLVPEFMMLLHVGCLQSFGADLLVADPGNLGGWALADTLKLQKAMIQVPGFTPPLVRHVAKFLLTLSACKVLMVIRIHVCMYVCMPVHEERKCITPLHSRLAESASYNTCRMQICMGTVDIHQPLYPPLGRCSPHKW